MRSSDAGQGTSSQGVLPEGETKRPTVHPIDNVLESLEQSGLAPCRIAGFALVAEEGVPVARLSERSESAGMVSAFVGPYGRPARAGRTDGFEWAAAHPGPEQILSTWSDYQDDRSVCGVEGEFYSEAWGYRPRIGSDPHLARIVSQNVLERGPEQLDQLNGMFSGFLYSPGDRRLWLFVDRGGVRLLFYRVVNGRWEAASNLYGFRRSRTPLALDAVSLNEQLFFGTPLEGKSLFEGVRVVQPGSVVELGPGGSKERRYYHFPARLRGQSVGESAEMICSALDRHVGGLGLEQGRCGIGLSSGKDSRTVLAGLLRADLAPVATIFRVREHDSDASNALRLAQRPGSGGPDGFVQPRLGSMAVRLGLVHRDARLRGRLGVLRPGGRGSAPQPHPVHRLLRRHVVGGEFWSPTLEERPPSGISR